MKIYAPTERRASRSCSPPQSINTPGSAPVGFDPAAHPIIARHWFGVEPFRQIGEVAAEVAADLRFRRQVERVHRLGPRAVGELLQEIGADRSCLTAIETALERYTGLDCDVVAAGGANHLPAVPIHAVSGDDLPPSPEAA